MVAMRGWIMPTPLATPDTVTRRVDPSAARQVGRAGRPLGPRVGGPERLGDGHERVIGARQPLGDQALQRRLDALHGIPRADHARSRPPGCASVARPALQPSTSARRRWSAMPASPVAALAQPLTDSSAAVVPYRPTPPGSTVARCARLSRTGAEANRLGVNVAATDPAPPVDEHDRQVGSPGLLDARGRRAGPEATSAGERRARPRAGRTGTRRAASGGTDTTVRERAVAAPALPSRADRRPR